MLSIFLFPSSSREPYSKTVAHIIPRLQWDYKRKTEENNQLEEIIGKHSEENRQILHDKHRQQLSSQSSHLLTAICKDILR